MKHFDEKAHSFIVRIWMEPREIENAAPKLRGVIEDVSTGERRHVGDLIDIERFIARYLKSMGVRPGRFRRLHRWFLPFPTGSH